MDLPSHRPRGLHPHRRRGSLLSYLSCLSCLSYSSWLLWPQTTIAQTPSPLCPEELGKAVEQELQTPDLRGSHWGMSLQPLGKAPLYDRNGRSYFVPASNAKLFTAAAAWIALGPDFRFLTRLYLEGKAPRLERLTIVAGGDPSLTTDHLTAAVQWLQSLGVKEIATLAIVAPPTTVPTPPTSWEWGDLRYDYGSAAPATLINGNTVTMTLIPRQVGQAPELTWSNPLGARQWRIINQVQTIPGEGYHVEVHQQPGDRTLRLTGTLGLAYGEDPWPLAIPDADRHYQDHWLQAIAAGQITLGKTLWSQNIPNGSPNFAIPSLPLKDLLIPLNSDSDNLYAEAIGQVLDGRGEDRRQRILQDLGLDSSQHLQDYAGLSRQNLVTPQDLNQLLQSLAQRGDGEVFRQTLAIAGERGTLKNRFQNTPLAGHLWGKTGTLTGVSALSGYLENAQGQFYSFSILVNNSTSDRRTLRQSIDRLALLFQRTIPCDPEGKAVQAPLHRGSWEILPSSDTQTAIDPSNSRSTELWRSDSFPFTRTLLTKVYGGNFP